MSFPSRYDEEMSYEAGAALGDPRRCPRHPGERTSSPDGMFDAPCGRCEHEADVEAEEAARESYKAGLAGADEPVPAEHWAGGPADAIRWERDARRLSAEASSLGFRAGEVPAEVHVRSRRTGATRTFRLASREVRGGDLLWWTLRSADGHSLVLFND